MEKINVINGTTENNTDDSIGCAVLPSEGKLT